MIDLRRLVITDVPARPIYIRDGIAIFFLFIAILAWYLLACRMSDGETTKDQTTQAKDTSHGKDHQGESR